MNKLITLPKLKKKAWKLISIYVRSRDADCRGYNSCYTCGRKYKWQELDCGHYVHSHLDFDLRNLRPQCTYCNRYSHGNLRKYTQRLIKENSLEWVEQLERDAKAKGNHYTRIELNEIIKDLENKTAKFRRPDYVSV